MRNPYRARVDERHFLNLPGFHGGAYVQAYVEDTTDREIGTSPYDGGRENPRASSSRSPTAPTRSTSSSSSTPPCGA